MAEPPAPIDALLPREIAHRAEEIGIKKALLDLPSMFMLAVLAGAFVAVGGVFSTVAATGLSDGLPYGMTRILSGLVFCLGLILIVLAGAELFTGNTLIVMAWASRKVSTAALLRNWLVVYMGNLAGSLATAALVFLAGQHTFAGGLIGRTMLSIANAKVNLDFVPAVALGILCNGLVCLAVWLTIGARTTTDKILAILFPITAFSASGFEHSIANMYFIAIGLLVKQFDPDFAARAASDANLDLSNLTFAGFWDNLIPVTIGNIIGGVVLVAAVYWFIYLRPAKQA